MSAKQQTIAIITGNSNSGSSCIKELYERYSSVKLNIRAAFRTEDKAAPLRKQYPQLEVVVGVDANKPDTLVSLFQGASSALIVTPHDYTQGFGRDAEMTANMINSAVSNGVKYIVLVASFTVNEPVKMGKIASRFISSEELLKKLAAEKKVNFTVLRGGYFAENTIHQFHDSIKNESAIKLFRNAYIPAVDTRDIGKSAAAVLSANDPIHYNKFYEISGPALLSGQDFANILSKVLEREIKFIELPDKALEFVPEPFNQLNKYFIEAGRNAIPLSNDVKTLTGQNTTYEQFVRDHKDAFLH